MTIWPLVRKRFYRWPWMSRLIADQFHRMYYYTPGRTWLNASWLGTGIEKCPLDLWVYQEMLHEIRPDLVVETGTAHGGSALYLASLFDLLGTGRVVTIDVAAREGRPQHPRITYLTGSSISDEIQRQVRAQVRPEDRVMVILDSDHSKAHVLAELRSYAELVSPGSYCVVEDSNVNGHPVAREFGAGPMEAVDDFLKETEAFVVDRKQEKFYLTFNPRG